MDPSHLVMPWQLAGRPLQPGPRPCSPGHPSAEHAFPLSPSPGSHTVWSCLLETGHPCPSHAFLNRKEEQTEFSGYLYVSLQAGLGDLPPQSEGILKYGLGCGAPASCQDSLW